MRNSISDRIGARVAAKLQQDVGHRADFHFTDYRMAGTDVSTICIAFDAGVGRPTPQDVADYVTRGFQGRLVPHMSTLRLHAAASALTLNVSPTRPCRDVKDIEAMVSVGGNRYIEAATKEVWEIEDNDGTPGLYRVAEEDMEAILAERLRQVSSRYASAQARVAKVLEDGRLMAVPGADVLFFNQNGEEKVGRVMCEPDDHGYLSVKVTGQTEPTRIHENQVHEMLVTAELDANTKKLLQDYYAQAFGDPEYARQLVQGNVITGSKDELVAFLTETGAMSPQQSLAWADTLRIGTGKVMTCGPNDMILGRYNGFGYEWQVDYEKADAAIRASLQK